MIEFPPRCPCRAIPHRPTDGDTHTGAAVERPVGCVVPHRDPRLRDGHGSGRDRVSDIGAIDVQSCRPRSLRPASASPACRRPDPRSPTPSPSTARRSPCCPWPRTVSASREGCANRHRPTNLFPSGIGTRSVGSKLASTGSWMGQANLERHRREARFGEPIACLAFPKWAKERAFIVSVRQELCADVHQHPPLLHRQCDLAARQPGDEEPSVRGVGARAIPGIQGRALPGYQRVPLERPP